MFTEFYIHRASKLGEMAAAVITNEAENNLAERLRRSFPPKSPHHFKVTSCSLHDI